MLGFFSLILLVYYSYRQWINPLNPILSVESLISLSIFFAPFIVVSLLKPVRRFLMSQRKIIVIPHLSSLIAVIAALLLHQDPLYYTSILLIVTPILYAALRGKPDYMSLLGGFEDEDELKYYDKKALEVAKKYGGILTKVILVHEADMSLNTATKTLQRLVDHGVAKKVIVYGSEIVDVPSSRSHLSKLDREIMEALISHEGILVQSTLLRSLNVPVEALKRALLRLEAYGILNYDEYSTEVKLRNINS